MNWSQRAAERHPESTVIVFARDVRLNSFDWFRLPFRWTPNYSPALQVECVDAAGRVLDEKLILLRNFVVGSVPSNGMANGLSVVVILPSATAYSVDEQRRGPIDVHFAPYVNVSRELVVPPQLIDSLDRIRARVISVSNHGRREPALRRDCLAALDRELSAILGGIGGRLMTAERKQRTMRITLSTGLPVTINGQWTQSLEGRLVSVATSDRRALQKYQMRHWRAALARTVIEDLQRLVDAARTKIATSLSWSWMHLQPPAPSVGIDCSDKLPGITRGEIR